MSLPADIPSALRYRGVVSARTRILPALLLVAYALGMGAACPPAPPSGHAAHGSHASADAMPCHEEVASADLRAPCPCGCQEGQRAPRAPLGLEPGFVSLGRTLRLPLASAPAAPATAALPAPPLRGIDHVPLSA